MNENQRLATLWLKHDGKRATEKQVAKLVNQFPGEIGEVILRRVCADRGLI